MDLKHMLQLIDRNTVAIVGAETRAPDREVFFGFWMVWKVFFVVFAWIS